ncbi:MAG TPA: SAM-dependent methyltransferase, partial [Solirubrobacteraceae bacterium]|nr:SAM-dependent methyltransferase [Solirubrobacteraceae bacterium]
SIRAAQSVWALLERDVEERTVERLAGALHSGAWDAVHGHLRERESFDGSLRLVISERQWR